ncbi:hypothetical protein ACM01_15075 [Streptomyces viridochromogenes]|uniref:Uncharacterized protein n=1 Tax=Streptomyces viridochromogenes TaxID=1938 RepID=A0A0J7ZDS2_STRVR|nr:hypothetical protein [Streptomyces viridochromogenes]KMS74236.1 hypothetical protein ACM01_15075 [Streptomyces viridochromogenes]
MRTPELTLSGALVEQAALDGDEARFRLLLAPEGDHGQELTPHEHDVREAVLPCYLSDPVGAPDVAALPPGAPLKVTGYLALPDQPTTPLRLVVHTVQPEDPEHEAFATPAPLQRPALRLVRAGGPSAH